MSRSAATDDRPAATRGFPLTAQQVAERHAALHTRYVKRPGLRVPFQTLDPEPQVAWRGPEDGSGAAAEPSLDRPFAATLTRRGADDHLLDLRAISLSSDLRSLERIVRDLLSAYGAALGAGPGPGEEPVQSLELGQWLESLADEEEAREGAAFWRQRLEAADPERLLPFERAPEDPLAAVEIESVPMAIGPETASALAAVAEDLGVGLGVLASGAWRAVLAWLGGGAEPAVSEALDGRPFEELEVSVGRFALLAPVPVAPVAGEPFAELCRRIEAARREGEERQEYQAALRGRWAASEPRSAVDFGAFPARFEGAEGVDGAALDVAVESVRAASEPVALALRGVAVGDRLDLELGYEARRVSLPRAERLARIVSGVLRAVAEAPEAPVEGCVRRALDPGDASVSETPRTADAPPRPLLERVAEQAERVPDRAAVQDGDRVLSFGALRRRALQVARRLRREGIGAEDVVAVCVLDPLELVPALLGTLETGAAYLPLDPTYPEERIAHMCRDSGARLLLTGGLDGGAASPNALDVAADLPRLDVDSAWSEEPSAPTSGISPESLAYVLYTSGSTGLPKGVMVPHGPLASYLAWCARRYGAGEGSGSVVHTPLGFDLTVTSLFGPLACGRRVAFAPLEQRVEGLAGVLTRERDLSLIKITPSQLHLLERFLPAEEAEGRARMAVIGGESLLGEHLAFWRRYAPGMRLVNEYGPTETVVGCCVHEAGPDAEPGAHVSIGRAIEGVRIALVDDRLDVLPRGIAGEIAVGGASVTRGYLGRPARTAEGFVPDPFASIPGARLYRTGDLALMDEAGDLGYLGRADRQVKLRGFRVELGEVEAILARHPGVASAVATVRRDGRGEARLVAYVQPAPGAEAASAELVGWTRRFVPDHMIPSALVPVPEIPLTSHGKVDLEALPEPETGRPDLAVGYAPPENELQRKIAEIWKELLQMDEVGIHDNFFDLGGHSYLMFEVHRRLAESFGRELSMVRLFQHPTVAALARFLSREDGAADSFAESERRGEGRRESMTRKREGRRERKLAQS